MEITYLNENLAPGHLGYFFVVLSFGMAILGLIAYFLQAQNPGKGWKAIGRTAFHIHGLSVIGVFATLFYLIYNQQFQYHYVWSHTSTDLPTHYIIASFWEGQEGSFLLWTLWHYVLGAILLFTAKSWEGPVMAIICLAQVMLSSMLLGLEELSLFGAAFELPFKLGSNPFILFRQAMPEMPLFQNPNYVGMISDGRGLNALLQNYWMTIHPPVLFLGFASTIVPFAFAMGALWQRRYDEWIRPALPWTVFGGMILGTGILMGGAWAYEALSFGGFWAWDPVENASLVPWLLFIGGLHTMMIYRARKTTLSASYILIALAFLLILYSTFLTRSGILGDSSVHSFTDLGLSGQLLIFMGVFFVMALIFIIARWKGIPKSEKEESTYSREFWMFIGALVLSLSALHIISITSIPVINKIFSTRFSPPTDPITTYHQLQIPFVIIIALLTGVGQYFRYHHTNSSAFWRRTGISAGVSILLATVIALLTGVTYYKYLILLWACSFTVIANGDYFLSLFRKSNLKLSGAAVAHCGFGLMLMGALISNAKKEVISINTEGFEALETASVKEQMENKVLFKDFPVQMGDYQVTFRGDSTDEKHIYFKVNYKKFDENEEIAEEFDLYPHVIFDKEQDQFTAASPSTRHYLTKDVFTHITAASNKNLPEYQVQYDTLHSYQVKEGQKLQLDSFTITIKEIVAQANPEDKNNFKLTMAIEATDGFYTYEAEPGFVLEDAQIYPQDDEIKEFGLKFRYQSVNPQTEEHELIIMQGNRPPPQFITLKAVIFPMINLLWIGTIIMITGFFIAMMRRIKEYKVA